MTDQMKRSILSFVKKNQHELKENVQSEDFAELLQEVYAHVDNNETNRAKAKFIKNQLDDGDQIKVTDFIEKSADTYLERLVSYVEKSSRRDRDRSRSKEAKHEKDDPLEQNNIKSSASSSSDNEDRNARRHHKLQIQPRRDRRNSRDQKDSRQKRDDRKPLNDKDRKNPRNFNVNKKNQKMPPINMLPNLLMMGMQGQQFNFDSMMKAIRPNQNNRKDTVFLVNLPREFRTLSEIEQIFKDKGEINNVSLGGKVPSVQFKKQQDAQSIINGEFLVHKGVKLDFSNTAFPNRKGQQRRPPPENLPEEEIIKQRKIEDTKSGEDPEAQVQALKIVQQQGEVQETQADINRKKIEQAKLEREHAKQIESSKSNISSLLAEKQRTILCLSKRNYPQELKDELEEIKNYLKQKRDSFKNLTDIAQLKQFQQDLEEMLDHSLYITEIPEEIIQNKTVMKVLNDHFQQFGKIENLQLKIKDRMALIKYMNFEYAERAHNENTTFGLEFIHQNIMKFILSN